MVQGECNKVPRILSQKNIAIKGVTWEMHCMMPPRLWYCYWATTCVPSMASGMHHIVISMESLMLAAGDAGCLLSHAMECVFQ